MLIASLVGWCISCLMCLSFKRCGIFAVLLKDSTNTFQTMKSRWVCCLGMLNPLGHFTCVVRVPDFSLLWNLCDPTPQVSVMSQPLSAETSCCSSHGRLDSLPSQADSGSWCGLSIFAPFPRSSGFPQNKRCWTALLQVLA